ncbi:MAG: nicotinate-nucleotide adenylyltransferase [Nitrospirae bacterium]|nr:nicotinate-nucleotide adenylyltransferase [Nitrospirota bacterium]
MANLRLGIFGGTFNPIHYGHLRAAEEARQKKNLDRIIFIPAGNPPLKCDDLIDISHRYLMTELAINSNSKFSISDIEVDRDRKSYAVDTIARLLDIYPKDDISLIMGGDAFLDIRKWKQHERLMAMTDFLVMSRHGIDLSVISDMPFVKETRGGEGWLLVSGKTAASVQITHLDISSTQIRGLLKSGKSIKYLLPDAVEKYIISNKLYA